MSPVDPSAAARAATSERVVARLRRHGRVLILPSIALVVLVGGTAYATGLFTEMWQKLAVLGLGLLLVVLLCVLPFLGWLTARVTITNRRAIVRTGMFAQVSRELPFRRGYEVSVRQTPGQRMAGSGDVRIEVGRDRPFVLKDLPKPQTVQQALNELLAVSPAVAPLAAAMPDGDTVTWGRR